MKIIITENQYNLLTEMEDDLISYESDFESGINILVIFESNPNYPNLVDFFEEYGYGFYFPEQNLIINHYENPLFYFLLDFLYLYKK